MPYKDKGKEKRYWRKYRKEHKEERREYHRKYYKLHKEELDEWNRKYRRRHREETRARAKESDRKVRERCLKHYGKKCACCGEKHEEFLGIDHIEGGGTKHRKKIHNLYRWLIRNRFPRGFRLLCHNCNLSLGFYGYCPHKRNGRGE
jgi:hypothetical protein